jgi:hypothetical protein
MAHYELQRRKEICLLRINCHYSSVYVGLQLTAILIPLVSGAFNLVCKHLAISFSETFRRTAFPHAQDNTDTLKRGRYMAIHRLEYEITIPPFEP